MFAPSMRIANAKPIDLPLLERARGARRAQDGEEECCLHKGRRESGRERGQRRAVCG